MSEISPTEVHLLNKMNGDDLATLRATKLYLTAIASVLITLAVCITAYNITDRIEVGHAVITTKTEQTANYPDQKHTLTILNGTADDAGVLNNVVGTSH